MAPLPAADCSLIDRKFIGRQTKSSIQFIRFHSQDEAEEVLAGCSWLICGQTSTRCWCSGCVSIPSISDQIGADLNWMDGRQNLRADRQTQEAIELPCVTVTPARRRRRVATARTIKQQSQAGSWIMITIIIPRFIYSGIGSESFFFFLIQLLVDSERPSANNITDCWALLLRWICI